MINRIVANVKFNTTYACSNCGKLEVGETVRAEIDVCSSDALKNAIDKYKQDSKHMPTGWHFNGRFNCGCSK